jgi:phage gp36-like protein
MSEEYYSTVDDSLGLLTRLAKNIHEEKAPFNMDKEDIPRLIEKADGIIDGYIGNRYNIPLDTPLIPQLGVIRTCSTLLTVSLIFSAIYQEKQSSDEPSIAQIYWNRAEKILIKIQEGKLSLYEGSGGAKSIEPSSSGGMKNFNSITTEDLEFTREKIRRNPTLIDNF